MMNENGFGNVPENKVREDTIKFASELDEKILPLMPKGKNASLIAQRQFLGIIAERQARLKKQIEWIRERQEYYRQIEEQ